MDDRTVARDHVLALLHGVTGELAARIRELLTEESLPALAFGGQPADMTRRIFALKYSIAQEDGVLVMGLDALLNRLDELGSQEIAMCVVHRHSSFGVVVLDGSGDQLHGLLYVSDTTLKSGRTSNE